MPHPKRQVEFVCEICSKTFSVKASVAAKGRRYCSWDCMLVARADTRITVNCEQCGKQIETYKKNRQRYCSISCAITARNLTDKNPSYHRDLSGPNNPMYGQPGLRGEDNPMYGRYGPDNPSYKNGRKEHPLGYVLVLAPKDHPSRSNSQPYILEHRLVMEEYLGRYLDPEEVVHHIDGNPANNAIENLQLFANQSDHIRLGHGNQSTTST